MLDHSEDLAEAKRLWLEWFLGTKDAAEQITDRACVHCAALIPSSEPRVSANDGEWLHRACEAAYIADWLGFRAGDLVDSDLKSKHIAFVSKRIRGFDIDKKSGRVFAYLEGEAAAVELKDIVHQKGKAAYFANRPGRRVQWQALAPASIARRGSAERGRGEHRPKCGPPHFGYVRAGHGR